ncbi:DNA-directed RNA polymerase subunit beta [Granulicatella sp. zg-84]|uniref:DNA-directed RNA polymerase subunit beta n=1 Tax=unclassified Granulicatella TaxID=2630493 RepID=UPI0031F6888D
MSKDNKKSLKTVSATQLVFLENDMLRILFYCIFMLVLVGVFLVIGLMIGYSILGDGNAFDVFNWHTWQHILDFLK